MIKEKYYYQMKGHRWLLDIYHRKLTQIRLDCCLDKFIFLALWDIIVDGTFFP